MLLVFIGSLTSTLICCLCYEVTKDIPAALIVPVLNNPTDQTLDYN